MTSLRQAWRASIHGLLTIAVLTGFANLLKFSVPLYIFQLLDRVISSRSVDTLLVLSVITVFAVTCAALIEYVRRLLLGRWGIWLEETFGRGLFVSSLEGRRARNPARALSDLAELRQFVSSSSAVAWLDVLFAPAFVLVVYLIHPLLSLVVVLGIALILSLGLANEWVSRGSREAARKAKSQSEGWLQAAIANHETVFTLSISDRVAERWQEGARGRLQENWATRMRATAFSDAMRFTEICQRIACYAIGVWLVLSAELTIGGVIAAAVLGRIGSSSVRRAMAGWRDLTLARQAYARTARRTSKIRSPMVAVRDSNRQQRLSLSGVTYACRRGERTLFRHLSLQLDPGHVACVLGPSGSGKSTLARLLSGALSPDAGRVRLGDLEIARLTPHERNDLIGYQEQDVTLFPATIAENICGLAGGDDEADAIVKAAKQASVHRFIVDLPSGYETVVKPSETQFSVGERKRIGLARAFFAAPALVVLDEPEANLDEKILDRLRNSIAQLARQGSAIVILTQSDAFLDLATKVVVLGRGSRAAVFDDVAAYRASRARNASATNAISDGGDAMPAAAEPEDQA